jgi:uncharacterized protein YggE
MRTRSGVATIAGLGALAVSAAPALAQAPAPGISVTGHAQVKPAPRDRNSNASIRKAVEDARAKATPRAIADGRLRATQLSALTGIALGPLVSVAETQESSPFYFGGPFAASGTFGPGKYCGNVRSFSSRRNAAGQRVRVRGRTRRVCRVPQFVSADLTMVFASG